MAATPAIGVHRRCQQLLWLQSVALHETAINLAVQVYPSNSDLVTQLVEDGDGGGYENVEADGHGPCLPSGSTTFDNELFIEALAKKEAKVDFINPLALGSPSPTKQALRPACMPDSLLGTADVCISSGRGCGTLSGGAAGCGDTGSMQPVPLSAQHSVEPSDTGAAELLTRVHSATLASAVSSPQRLASRRPSALTVVVESGAPEDPQPSLMHVRNGRQVLWGVNVVSLSYLLAG